MTTYKQVPAKRSSTLLLPIKAESKVEKKLELQEDKVPAQLSALEVGQSFSKIHRIDGATLIGDIDEVIEGVKIAFENTLKKQVQRVSQGTHMTFQRERVHFIGPSGNVFAGVIVTRIT